ncbi:MAG: hypothetical protein SGPRY_011584 [Prymnesium sp.]
MGYSAVHVAAMQGRVEAIKLLLEHKAHADAMTSVGDTPLHLAAQGHVRAVALLLEHGLQVDVRNDFGETPLFMAALAPDFEAPTEGHVEVVNLLLERQADVNAKDCVKSRSTLAFALQQEGHSALHGAGEADCMENVLLLLEASADPTASVPHFSLSPYPLLPLSLLTVAFRCGRFEIQLSTTQFFGDDFPLHGAAVEGRVEFIKLLLECAADVNAMDIVFGRSPLYLAVTSRARCVDAVKLLLEYGADTFTTNETGEVPLHGAAKGGETEMLQLLLEHKPDINARDDMGHTPLHFAAREGHIEAVKMLLESKAYAHVENHAGATPLTLASSEVNAYLLDLILREEGTLVEASLLGRMEGFGHLPTEITRLIVKHWRNWRKANLLEGRE